MKLKEYKQKRDLKKTTEPGPSFPSRDKTKFPVFVVHKHAARNLHYDLRLEMDGVLKSWAVPKGPSLDTSVKRLAVHVEDHPYDYKDFEGNIPKGNYGAGNVIIWDRGFYSHPLAKDRKNNERLLLEGLKKGDLKFMLMGEKLKGLFALVKTGYAANSWLLIKEKDNFVSAGDILSKNRSVVSGRTVEEIPTGNSEPGGDMTAIKTDTGKAPKVPMPHKVSPMLSTAAKKPFNHPDWLFEIKWDGYRAIAETGKQNAALYSRNGLSLAGRFPPIAASLQKFGFAAVLDGEIIALDKSGRPDFQLLQDFHSTGKGRLVYYVFDILFHNGRDLTTLPLIQRKELLKKILPPSGNILFSGHVIGEGVPFFNAAKKKGLEGIVAKNINSAYRPATRSDKWIKIKNRVTQDCVIAGYTAPRGSRKYLGSLVLGVYKDAMLVYAGNSGGSFGGRKPKEIFEMLQPLKQKKCPLAVKPPEGTPVTWIKPELVCEMAFTEWTREGAMRHPVFIKMRDDMSPKEAVKTEPR